MSKQSFHEFTSHEEYLPTCTWCNEQRADMELRLARPALDTAIRTGRFSAWSARVHAGEVAQANAYATLALLAEQKRTNALLEQITKQANQGVEIQSRRIS